MKSVWWLLAFLTFAGCAARKIETVNPSEIKHQTVAVETPEAESAEEKAVRRAEEFIRQNGYTTAPADRENLAHENVEFYDSIDDLLKERYNTLETKADGVSPQGKGSRKGWTVVFRYSERIRRELEKSSQNARPTGRAVTMDENFQNLRVEHEDFFLDKIGRKL